MPAMRLFLIVMADPTRPLPSTNRPLARRRSAGDAPRCAASRALPGNALLPTYAAAPVMAPFKRSRRETMWVLILRLSLTSSSLGRCRPGPAFPPSRDASADRRSLGGGGWTRLLLRSRLSPTLFGQLFPKAL